MSSQSAFIERLAEQDRAGQRFVVVTLVDAVGSTPQDVGAKILVDRNGLVAGTVGGGRVERKAIETAQQILAQAGSSPATLLMEWNLQQDLDIDRQPAGRL